LTSTVWDISWHRHARHIREDRLGLASARLRGIQEAAADILIFVDDDNVLAPDYLEQALCIGRKWPVLGVWGSGVIAPEFEVQPPRAVLDYLNMVAIRDVKTPQWTNVMPCYYAMPWGAGQCVRARVASAYRQYFGASKMKLNDRTGGALDSGGDLEIDYVACTLGLGVGIFPELKLTHLIPKERLNDNYLVKLVEGISASGMLLEYKFQSTIPVSPFSGLLGIPRVIRNVLVRRGIERRVYVAQLRSRIRARRIILEHTSRNV
jgi:glycosyltransferase involved in cell wall biosynthesis